MAFKDTLDEYLRRYEAEHTKFATRLTHVVGIPLIVASLPLLFVRWKLGLALFVLGWVFQFIGHRIEGNKPAFFGDPLYLLVGVIWVGQEILGWFSPRRSA
ncbi:DUF962 domain-containing protein [bacterium]|nr:DUF962 domain-containing protein [bacterium]